MEAQGELMVHLMVEPCGGLRVNRLVWVVPGQVAAFTAIMQSGDGFMLWVRKQELLQPLVSITVRFTVTLPVMLGIAILTV